MNSTLIIAVVLAFAPLYPAEAMNARGERILVLGDSLSEHAGSVPIWNVSQGSQRQSSSPGDLLASLLLDQGAAAVRVNAKSGRSAVSFWSTEPGAQLVAADLTWRPTKVVFVLGTNDVGMPTATDEFAFRRLREAYGQSGAELWAIGPFTNRQDKAAQEIVIGIMSRAFGRRFIDGRPLSKMISPTGDGIHYDSRAARALALNMADALLSTSTARAWTSVAIGAAIVIGGALTLSLASRRRRDLSGLDIIDGKRWSGSTSELVRAGYKPTRCKSGLDAKGLARCWTRAGLKGLDMPSDDRERLASVILDFKEIARRRGYGERKNALGSCDIATAEFVRRAAEAGVELRTYRFDLTSKRDLSRLARLYKLSPKETASIKREAAADPDSRDCMYHEVAISGDGWVVDWTANQFKSMPVPYVFLADRKLYATAKSLPAAPAAIVPKAPALTRRLPANAAEIVDRAARAVPSAGRYGDDKIFISDVHAQLAPLGVHISLEDFKRELLRMLREDQVLLTRADLVGAMDPERVQASEIHDMGADFHFVTLPYNRKR